MALSMNHTLFCLCKLHTHFFQWLIFWALHSISYIDIDIDINKMYTPFCQVIKLQNKVNYSHAVFDSLFFPYTLPRSVFFNCVA